MKKCLLVALLACMFLPFLSGCDSDPGQMTAPTADDKKAAEDAAGDAGAAPGV